MGRLLLLAALSAAAASVVYACGNCVPVGCDDTVPFRVMTSSGAAPSWHGTIRVDGGDPIQLTCSIEDVTGLNHPYCTRDGFRLPATPRPLRVEYSLSGDHGIAEGAAGVAYQEAHFDGSCGPDVCFYSDTVIQLTPVATCTPAVCDDNFFHVKVTNARGEPVSRFSGTVTYLEAASFGFGCGGDAIPTNAGYPLSDACGEGELRLTPKFPPAMLTIHSVEGSFEAPLPRTPLMIEPNGRGCGVCFSAEGAVVLR